MHDPLPSSHPTLSLSHPPPLLFRYCSRFVVLLLFSFPVSWYARTPSCRPVSFFLRVPLLQTAPRAGVGTGVLAVHEPDRTPHVAASHPRRCLPPTGATGSLEILLTRRLASAGATTITATALLGLIFVIIATSVWRLTEFKLPNASSLPPMLVLLPTSFSKRTRPNGL